MQIFRRFEPLRLHCFKVSTNRCDQQKMSDWSSTFWGSTAGLFGEEDEGDTFDPDQQVSTHEHF